MTKVKRILDETTLEPYFHVTELPDSPEVINERVAYSRGVVRVINDDEIEIRRGETQFPEDAPQSREDLIHGHKRWWGMWTPIEIQRLVEGQQPSRVLVVQFRPDPATGGWHMRSSLAIGRSKLRRLTEHGLLVVPQPQTLYDPETHAYSQHYLLYARVGLRLPGTKAIAALLEARLEDTEDPGDEPVVVQIG